MELYCPYCREDVKVNGDGYCGGCGLRLVKRKRAVHSDEFEAEDEWTQSDWGEELEQVKKKRDYI